MPAERHRRPLSRTSYNTSIHTKPSALSFATSGTMGWRLRFICFTLFVVLRHVQANKRRPALVVRSRVPAEVVPKISLPEGDALVLFLYNNSATEIYQSDGSLAVRWNAPIWQAEYKKEVFPVRLFAPAVILNSNVPRLKIVNNLPFQSPCSCGCTVAGNSSYCDACVAAFLQAGSADNPLGIYDGAHDLVQTNLHTHGLKVDVGASDINNLDVCVNLYTREQLCQEQSFDPSKIECQIFSDNVFPDVLSGGMKATNTYFLPRAIPGTAWYHHHYHGSVAYLNPFSNGLLLTPDIDPRLLFTPADLGMAKDFMGVTTWHDIGAAVAKYPEMDMYNQYKLWSPETHWPKSLEHDAYDFNLWIKHGIKPHKQKACQQFIELIGANPNFSPQAEIIHIAGLWFRKTLDGSYSDDSHAFIACNALPPSPLIAPDGLQNGPCTLVDYNNQAGRDYAAVNSVIQPTLKLTAGKYKRWNILNTFTMKWLDITVHKFEPGKTTQFTMPTNDCKMWLLTHDGVYLEKIPRFPESFNKDDPNTKGKKVNNLILGPANRAEVFIKCTKPGTYALVSGAGPFQTSPLCGAVHCELFGGESGITGAINGTGNNFWGDQPLNAALLAVIDVKPTSAKPDPDLVPLACRTRLEMFEYLAYREFPKPGTAWNQEQCWNLVNMANGGACNVNGVLFGNFSQQGVGLACMNQGFSQNWDYRGINFHPFHLHETPVRTTQVPACLETPTKSTNWWQVGDWWDTIFTPMCDCTVDGCETMPVQFKATQFPQVPQDYGTKSKTKLAKLARNYLRDYDILNNQFRTPESAGHPPTNIPCQDRFSVLHCHHLSHEDEGCMAAVFWNCIDKPEPGLCTGNGICPALTFRQRLKLYKSHAHI